MKQFTLEYWMDDGWFVGRLKDIPSVMSQGETLAELKENIRDAYKLVLADTEDEADIPRKRQQALVEM